MSGGGRDGEQGRWLVRVDTGGTFTDGWARDPGGRERRCKVLSSGVLRAEVKEVMDGRSLRLGSDLGAADGVLRGFVLGNGAVVKDWDAMKCLLRLDREAEWGAGEVVDLTTGEEAPVVAARLLTATPPGREFPDMNLRLATTRGTNALLERKGEPGVLLITEGFEDLLRIRDQRRPELFGLRQELAAPVFARSVGVRERVAADGRIVTGLEEAMLEKSVSSLVADGVQTVAVALLNAHVNPVHEQRVVELLRKAGIDHVSCSQELSAAARLWPRAETAVANAYLSPVMDCFVQRVGSGTGGGEFEMMTSAGALTRAADYRAIDSLLSGPAGGVVGALAAARAAGWERVIAFDMGGTSTDVARLEGAPEYRYEQEIGPVRVMAPAVRIETVAAGGGSICQWRNGALEVGPESAGAHPGPACYGQGGPLTITDVNLLLGCMDAGKAGIPLDVAASRRRFEELQVRMKDEGAEFVDDEALLEGLREIAVERMADAIRKVSLREGYDPAEYALVAFGGAGPQHACAVAGKLGVGKILVPGDAGLLSAWGLHRATREAMAERQVVRKLGEAGAEMEQIVPALEQEALVGLADGAVVSRYLVELRLVGQDTGVEVEFAAAPGTPEVAQAFAERYEAVYGYAVPGDRGVELVAVRVLAAEPGEDAGVEHFGGVSKQVHDRQLMQDSFRTCVVEPGWGWCGGDRGSLRLERIAEGRALSAAWSAEVEAELFRCRFENVVEEMGELLRRTAISTNVKERLDFSCAMLDAEGRLVVNAPHIPVHLGALGLCVREVSQGRQWRRGDMVVVNHPGFGGSHLPDVTVISPVFDEAGVLRAFVANRAHHAELGGLTPGSMPAGASCLEQEGVVIPPMLLFEAGKSRLDAVENHFRAAAFPSRSPEDNMADLAAQAAANRHGVAAVERLMAESSPESVARNMAGLFERAARIMRGRVEGQASDPRVAQDTMDDGSVVAVELRRGGSGLVVDFSGSAPEHPGNLNATPAIVRSAVLYGLRLWVDDDLPLNEGLLEPVDIALPRGMLCPEFVADPAACPAVVGGNVETSQRIVDVVLMALGLQANSQGTMNNLLFGTEGFGYYETIGGGSGAGPGWDGMSGTHVHMSNTAITDPEILERRFPLRLREFSLRKGSGGNGKWCGGDGLVREVEFLEAMTVSVLMQRRLTRPKGAEGGEDGAPGRQVLTKCDGRSREPAPVESFEVEAGDRLRIETPGGGGWGSAD